MSRKVTLAATQLAMSWDIDANLSKAEKTVRDAHAQGAQVILCLLYTSDAADE